MKETIRNRPPLQALFFLLLGILFHLRLRGWTFAPPGLLIAAALFIAAGLALLIIAAIQFTRAGTPLKPEKTPACIVERGLYRFSRNPMYLGMVLLLMGGALALGSLPAFTAPIGFALALNLYQVPREEKELEAQFGDLYLEYARRVRRWL
ncbi:MAG: isoprenylcysteine carboxylmethyltransferase family protein [bacterium]|nr:isoprenylcysteine carboxylmethyltransferase family protein [bacterium]